ncbi:MAG TPA: AarF/UbiB family protein [Actinomycetota bacterium]
MNDFDEAPAKTPKAPKTPKARKTPKAPKPRKPRKAPARATEPDRGSLTRRVARIGAVLARHGVRDVFTGGLATHDHDKLRASAVAFRDALQELGPTFSKLGQILSTRPDLLPAEFIAELESLQEKVTPLTEEQVVGAIETSLGVPWEDAFESIDPTPLAAGTIAQVHRAVLEDGEKVVVKVQRPNAEREIMQDLELLRLFAEQTADLASIRRIVDVPAIVDHLATSLERELDFTREAANIERMREVLAGFDRLGVPEVYDLFTSRTLLVLRFVDGVPLRNAPEVPERAEAAKQLLESYYHQVLSEGFFHADPHPGNMRWGNDNKIYLFDLGMVGELDPPVRDAMMLVVLSLWQEDARFLADSVLSLAEHDDVDVDAFTADVDRVMRSFSGKSLRDIQLGPLLQEMTAISMQHGVRLPASLALTAKALAQMQLATAELTPDLDPFSVAGRYMMRHIAGRVGATLAPGKMLYEASKVGARAGRILRSIESLASSAKGGRLQVQFRGTEGFEETIRRAGRRLALSLGATATITAAAIAGTSERIPSWLGITGVSTGAMLLGMLLADLLRRK